MVLIAGLPGGMEWLILLVVALLLFGGSRLAGVGKGMGRSIREFKDEVKGVEEKSQNPEVVDAEIVQPEIDLNRVENNHKTEN